MKQFAFAAVAVLALWPGCASAESWNLNMGDARGGNVLSAMPDEPESDTDLWLMCRKDGRFSVGVGANSTLGKGKDEAVSATLSSADKIAVLKGVSRKSINFEMTGGNELATIVSKDDPLFVVIATGKPIKMSSTSKTMTFDSGDAPKLLGKFIASCK
ncbi:MAG TPA: hypothetical protein VIJ85_11715 [Rhizomicrobium sp.]